MSVERTANVVYLLYAHGYGYQRRTAKVPISQAEVKALYGLLGVIAAGTSDDFDLSIAGRIRLMLSKGKLYSTLSGVYEPAEHFVSRADALKNRRILRILILER